MTEDELRRELEAAKADAAHWKAMAEAAALRAEEAEAAIRSIRAARTDSITSD